MSCISHGDLCLTELDHARINKLLAGQRSSPFHALLEVADIVAPTEVDPDVVTLYSQILVRDEASSELFKITLCYPQDSEPSSGFISVLSPVGLALLGRRVGSTSGWTLPSGEQRRLTIVDMLFQPEASGDYSL